jgi:hypothetical protein
VEMSMGLDQFEILVRTLLTAKEASAFLPLKGWYE